MSFELLFTQAAEAQLVQLEQDSSQTRILKAVRKALGLMQTNLRHPSLNTHKFQSLTGPDGQEVFEAYAEQRTPAAYRIFWCYGPVKNQITIIAITAHP